MDPEAFGTVAAIGRRAARRTSSHARRAPASAARRTEADAAAARSGVDSHRSGGGSKRNAFLSRRRQARRHGRHTASARPRARVLCSLHRGPEAHMLLRRSSCSTPVSWAQAFQRRHGQRTRELQRIAAAPARPPTVLVRRAGARGSVPRAASPVGAWRVSWLGGARPGWGEPRSASGPARPSAHVSGLRAAVHRNHLQGTSKNHLSCEFDH